ncbi:hypothetical protein C8R47DRAFT_470558 [Mycena vitilis]|nr:hypothetical protein C8R47DRAFT_470558 [Mycena vitilis]
MSRPHEDLSPSPLSWVIQHARARSRSSMTSPRSPTLTPTPARPSAVVVFLSPLTYLSLSFPSLLPSLPPSLCVFPSVRSLPSPRSTTRAPGSLRVRACYPTLRREPQYPIPYTPPALPLPAPAPRTHLPLPPLRFRLALVPVPLPLPYVLPRTYASEPPRDERPNDIAIFFAYPSVYFATTDY